jgi:protein phosphatase
LYGDSSGRPAADGLPERFNFGADYRGAVSVVYGHTPVAEPEWLNNTMCIDTGCVFGGRLTALRWPERELVSVAAGEAHAELRRPYGLPPARPVAETKP